jgi:dephospho-CoA kinase
MRRLAFADARARIRLEAILHPMILGEAQARIRASRAPYVVLVVPLLIESGSYRGRVDRLLVVDVEESTQLARVMKRSGLPETEVRRIMAAQATRERRLALADDVLPNDAGLEALRARVELLHQRYLDAANAARR